MKTETRKLINGRYAHQYKLWYHGKHYYIQAYSKQEIHRKLRISGKSLIKYCQRIEFDESRKLDHDLTNVNFGYERRGFYV